MTLSYPLVGVIFVILILCSRAAHYIYVGYIKAPRMIKSWKAQGNNDAAKKWEKTMQDYKNKYIPLAIAAALLFIVGLGLILLGQYLKILALSPH